MNIGKYKMVDILLEDSRKVVSLRRHKPLKNEKDCLLGWVKIINDHTHIG